MVCFPTVVRYNRHDIVYACGKIYSVMTHMLNIAGSEGRTRLSDRMHVLNAGVLLKSEGESWLVNVDSRT